VPLLEDFKKQRQPEESFGDYCQRLGVEKLQALLPAASGKAGHQAAAKASTASETPVEITNRINGHGHALAPSPAAPTAENTMDSGPGLTEPETRQVPLALPEPAVTPVPRPASLPKLSETFLAGSPGEELRDYSYRYNSDGSVRETVIYFYGSDCRAAAARMGDPLRREAVYQGRVDAVRLHAARKLSDTLHVGPAGHERRDVRVEYQPDGRILQTVVFHYEGDARAAEAPSGAPLRRQVAYEGALPS
jgi:hypothetical protein